MESLLDKLGIDWKLFIAQIVNFTILLFVLYKYAYKPVLEMLDKRAKMVARSVDEAKKAEMSLNEAEKMREESVIKARTESKKIIAEAKEIIAKEKENSLAGAKEESERIIKSGFNTVKQEKEKAKAQLEKEMSDLLLLGLEKVTAKTLTPEDQKKIIAESVNSLKFT